MERPYASKLSPGPIMRASHAPSPAQGRAAVTQVLIIKTKSRRPSNARLGLRPCERATGPTRLRRDLRYVWCPDVLAPGRTGLSSEAHVLRTVIGLVLVAAALPAAAQDNRGTSAQQLYGTNCAICHANPRQLAASARSAGLVGFLTEHYTTSQGAARALAAYLAAMDRGPQPTPPRQRPGSESSGRRKTAR